MCGVLPAGKEKSGYYICRMSVEPKCSCSGRPYQILSGVYLNQEGRFGFQHCADEFVREENTCGNGFSSSLHCINRGRFFVTAHIA